MQPCDLAIPMLPCRSVSATVAFYRRFGFEGGAHAFNSDYAILRRGAVELHFFTNKGLLPAESSSACYIRVLDVESMYRSFSSSQLPHAGIPRMDRLEDKPWGLREFAVVDLDGNLLRIGQVIHPQLRAPCARFGGSHRVLARAGWPDVVFAFHDQDEIGPRMLARIAKKAGLKPPGLQRYAVLLCALPRDVEPRRECPECVTLCVRFDAGEG